MLKPSFRYFIIPLGAISTLATLSAQERHPPRPARYRVDVLSASRSWIAAPKSPTQVCVISYDSEISR